MMILSGTGTPPRMPDVGHAMKMDGYNKEGLNKLMLSW